MEHVNEPNKLLWIHPTTFICHVKQYAHVWWVSHLVWTENEVYCCQQVKCDIVVTGIIFQLIKQFQSNSQETRNNSKKTGPSGNVEDMHDGRAIEKTCPKDLPHGFDVLHAKRDQTFELTQRHIQLHVFLDCKFVSRPYLLKLRTSCNQSRLNWRKHSHILCVNENLISDERIGEVCKCK